MTISTRTRASARLGCEPLEDRLAPAVAYALTSANTLLAFDTASPATTTSVTVTGVQMGEALVGIDVRPQNGFLYGLGVNAAADTGTLYAISVRTGVATPVGTPGGVAFVDTMGTPVDLPDPATTGYGVDFNPAVDRFRVVTGSGLNFRINPNTGAPIDGDTTANGINPDGGINIGGAPATVDGTAYTNNQPNNNNITTQYTLDSVTNTLYIQNPPNNGTQTNPLVVTLGGTTLDFAAVRGFDIAAGVNTLASNAPVAAGSGLAVLTVGGTNGLYSIDLVTGTATLVGALPANVRGFAIASDLGGVPAVALSADGTQIVRFNTATPGTTTTVMITGVNPGETLVGIDFRPQTGQLYALGIDATANTGTLYLVDPQLATLTAVGTPGQIAFVDTMGMAVDLPDPAVAGYGFDFNPTVDRIRVTTGTGLNFRVNPNGAPVDGDTTANGVNPDGPISGLGATGITGVAYTNSFGQPLMGGVTSQYTLDAASNTLFIQNPPNSGTQTLARPVTLNGAPLDFTAVSGFDIPSTVEVSASGTAAPAGSRGYAVLITTGVSRLYAIDLTTGAATDLGPSTAGLAGLALAAAPSGAVQFGAATFAAAEGGPAAVVTLTRTGGSSGPLTVTVAATGGTATPGVDFAAGPYAVTFADGQTTATLSIPLIDDTTVEDVETITLAITAVGGTAVIGPGRTATVTITDNDTLPGPGTPPPSGTGGPVAAGPTITVTRPDGTTATITPFAGFNGAVTTASGDVTGDGVDDVIVGAPVNGHVKVFDGATGAEVRSFFAFPGFAGAVYVAGGDVTGDGVDDVIVGAFVNGHVKVFDGATGAEVRSFFAYTGFAGEVRVGSGDIDGDGVDDIITGAGSGANGHVKVFSGATGAEIRSFFAYSTFNGGIFVTSGDVNGDGRLDIITGAEANSHVKAFDGADGTELRSFFAFQNFAGSARVAARRVNADLVDDIIVGTGPGAAGVRVFDGLTLALLSDTAVTDPFGQGVFVG